MVKWPENIFIVSSCLGKVNLPLKWMQTRSWSVAGIMEEQVVDVFNKPIHHGGGWRHPDIWFQKLSPLQPGCVFIEDPWK